MTDRIPLEIAGLTKTFATPAGPVVAVQDVNAGVHEREFACILGHSGCGKSTLLSIIAGLQHATHGRVVIDGAEVHGPGTDRAVVFQTPCLLPWLTVRENVALAVRQASPHLTARSESLAAFDGRCIPAPPQRGCRVGDPGAGCVAPLSNTPGILGRRALPAGRLARLCATPDSHHGLLTRAERRAHVDRYLALVGVADAAGQLPGELSLGTQQCVSLARALSVDPRFLLLDEPFSMLDSLTRFELQDILLDVWEQNRKIVVMVTHDVDEALYLADRLILMTDGPSARVGEILAVPFPRPRERTAVLEHPQYFELHGRVIDFLENHAGQSTPAARQHVPRAQPVVAVGLLTRSDHELQQVPIRIADVDASSVSRPSYPSSLLRRVGIGGGT